MTHDSTNQHLSLEPDYDGFDPLEDFEDDATEVEGRADEFVATVSAAEDALAHDAMAPATPAICEKPAEERIADLLEAMAPRRTVLLGILAACAEPQPASAVNARVDELQENNFSVYSAANLCSLLEKAGAIERVTAKGEPAEDIEIEPQTVVVDGVEYLEAREPVEIYWHITEPGRAALEADKPLERLRALLDEDAAYAPIYQRILSRRRRHDTRHQQRGRPQPAGAEAALLRAPLRRPPGEMRRAGLEEGVVHHRHRTRRPRYAGRRRRRERARHPARNPRNP